MKNYRWAVVMVGVIALLMVGSMVWAFPPSSGPFVPPLATPGLDADKVDGLHASKQPTALTLLALNKNKMFPASVIPGAITRDTEVMPIVKNNDGAGSGLDADLLDGQEGTYYYQDWNNLANIPACFADGVDNTDDTVSWSEILGIVGTGANQVAAGNHNHDAAYLNDDQQETISAAAAGPLLTVDNTGTGDGLFGDGGTGGDGLSGRASASNKSGVFGYNSGDGYGVAGRSANGWGIEATGSDAVGDLLLGGDWGEIYTFGLALGLGSNRHVAVFLDRMNQFSNAFFTIYDGTGTEVFKVFESGNVWKKGTVSAFVETESYGRRLLYAMESPEVWHEDFGTASLVNGVTTVEIEPIFAETVNLKETYHVFITALGDCGLYVADKSATSFTVRALDEKTCNIDFDYRIVAKRLGYESVRLESPTLLANPDE